MKCQCSKKGECQLLLDGELFTDASFNTCLTSSNSKDQKRNYRWARGRRSPDQSEASVSGGEDMELLDYCYDPTWYNLFDMKDFSSPDEFFKSLGDDFDVLKGMNLTADIPAQGLKLSMIMAMVTYGRVTEVTHPVGSHFNSDAGQRQLVCRYSNNKDFIVDRETYLQLSIRTGAVNWVDSELWYPMNNGANNVLGRDQRTKTGPGPRKFQNRGPDPDLLVRGSLV